MPENPLGIDWGPPPAGLGLSAGEVHVWRVALDQPDAVVAALRELLTAEERARADRYVMERDRRHFAVGRGWVRLRIGRYLGVDPARVVFRLGPHGKPAVADEGGPGLQFNLTHSHGLALFAAALDRPLGIDVERRRPMLDAEGLIERFFSARERDDFRALDEDDKLHAFFRAWTRKEAYMKAVGAGFALALDRFDVTLRPEEPPRLLRVEGEPEEPGRWSFRDLEPLPDYQAAVAVEGHGWRLLGFAADPEGELAS